jgi:hypothetical protein
MKNKPIFSGVILLGFGLYFFLQQTDIMLFQDFFSWPTLLCITGLAFLGQAYVVKDQGSILPGIILFGFGLHIHIAGKLDIWPDHIGVFLLIISFGLILQLRQTKSSASAGWVLLIISILTLYYDQIVSWLGLAKMEAIRTGTYWPFILIGIGIYMLFSRKK